MTMQAGAPRIVSFFPSKTKMIVGYAIDDRGGLWELQCDVNDEDGVEPNVYKWTQVPSLPAPR